MDLRDYEVKPDEQLFGKIQHRLKVRRMRRMAIGNVAAVSVIAAAVAIVLGVNGSEKGVTGSERANVEVVAAVTESGTVAKEVQGSVGHMREYKTNVVKSAVTTEESVTVNEEDLRELLPVGMVALQPVVEPEEGATTFSLGTIDTIPTIRQHGNSEIGVRNLESRVENEEKKVENGVRKAVVTAVSPLWAPNAIIPDGDEDENRYFKLVSASPITEFTVRIYNRRGIQVYTSNDPNFRWNATHNGTRVPQGAYVWTVKYRDSDGNVQQQRGSVVVVR